MELWSRAARPVQRDWITLSDKTGLEIKRRRERTGYFARVEKLQRSRWWAVRSEIARREKAQRCAHSSLPIVMYSMRANPPDVKRAGCRSFPVHHNCRTVAAAGAIANVAIDASRKAT